MNIDLTEKEFRRLLDLVYIGIWISNGRHPPIMDTPYLSYTCCISSCCFSIEA